MTVIDGNKQGFERSEKVHSYLLIKRNPPCLERALVMSDVMAEYE